MEHRLTEYHAQAELVLKRYPRVIAVDATGAPDEVWQRVARALDTLVENGGSGR